MVNIVLRRLAPAGNLALGVVMLTVWTVTVFFLTGALFRFANWAEPLITGASRGAQALCLLVFLPALFIPKIRQLAEVGFGGAAFIFVIHCAAFSFVVTYEIWGRVPAMIGLVLGGVMVIPMGIVAGLTNGQSASAISIFVLIAFWLCAIFGQSFAAHRREQVLA